MKKQNKRKRRAHYAGGRGTDYIRVPARRTGWDQSLRICNDRRMLWSAGNQNCRRRQGPSRKTVDGYSEVCFPVTAEFREQLYGKVLGAYRQVMREVQTAAVQGYGSPPPGPGEEAGYVQMQ